MPKSTKSVKKLPKSLLISRHFRTVLALIWYRFRADLSAQSNANF